MSTLPASARRRYGPAIPRWMLPSVHVRGRGDVITIEQRVPARVESIHTTSRLDSTDGTHVEHHTPTYESGLGSPTTLTLVKERLTVPANAVSEQQVRQTIKSTIDTYEPGTAPLSTQISVDAVMRLLQAIATLGLAGFGLYFLLIPGLFEITSRTASSASFDHLNIILLIIPAIIIAILLAIFVVSARAAWVLRTPKFVAEEQWGLLRQALTQLAGQEPGSSRPLDIEAGLRRDLITHPNGASSARGVTRDGRMGPPWPDAYDVARRVRQSRRTLAGLTVFASVFLIVGILIFTLFLSSGQFTLTPLIFGVSIFGAIISLSSKRCDRLIISYPSTMPGEEEPREISWEDVDAPSLPAWCDARRREHYWNLAAIVFLVEMLVAVLAIISSTILTQTMFMTSVSSAETRTHTLILNSVLALTVIAAALATVVIGGRWIRQKDSELRRRAGLA